MADGERRPGELLLCQREQEVRLVLVAIGAAQQQPAAICSLRDARVMTRGDVLGAKTARTIEERRELQVAVAVRARNGRAARRVFADEVRDDRVLELPLEVEDVVRDAERPGDAPRVVQIVERAAAAKGLAAALIVELHRQTNDVMTLLGEQGRGDRGVDASRHGNHDLHS